VSQAIERYGIYLADLDPTRGREIAKTRPVVVVSLDAMNRHLDTVVVCPLTTRLHPRWRSRIQCACTGRRAEMSPSPTLRQRLLTERPRRPLAGCRQTHPSARASTPHASDIFAGLSRVIRR
jgi:hypothetical protein